MFKLPTNEQGWGLFTKLIANFWRSQQGKQSAFLFASLIGLLLTVNLLNIINSFVGRDFMSALADRNAALFGHEALIYVLVFAALTIVAVLLRYCEERLGLLWREFMTDQFLGLYVTPPTYYRLNDELIRQSGVEHPDQRIADDVKSFTTTTLSFILMVLNGLFTVIAFSSVLWMISPWLFAAALLYAIAGSFITVLVGGRLVDLNYRQLDKEASFRSGLIHVKERAESIALLHQEGRIQPRLWGQFQALATNFKIIIEVNRNLGFFTTGYNWLIQIIPVLLVAPLFMEGRVEFGVVTQSAMAFAMLVGAFSLIVTQFQSLSSFAAVIQRLVNLWYVIELAQASTVSGLDIVESNDEIAFDHLTLLSPIDKRVLIKDLTLEIGQYPRVLITGNDSARDALFKAMAGLYDAGSGMVRRPPLDQILFLPERPYLPPGTLRDAVIPLFKEGHIRDKEVRDVLLLLGLGEVLKRAGGLDVEQEWDALLSAHEQRIVSFARILIAEPRYVVMANPYRDMDHETRTKVFSLLLKRQMSLVTMGHLGRRDQDDHASDYDAILELSDSGEWNWQIRGSLNQSNPA